VSNNVYPGSLPGLTYDSIRSPNFNTGVQQAMSGKESRIAYQAYCLMSWELTYEVLRDNLTISELKSLFGLMMNAAGKYDSFLYLDPQFNSVTHMPFAVTDGSTTAFQLTATYENSAGPGGAELIQNCNPYTMEIMRYGTLIEYVSGISRTQYALHSQDFTNASWTKSNVTAAVAAQAAPDGTLTANAIDDSTSSSVTHEISQTVASATAAGTYTWSVFSDAAPCEANYISMGIQDVTSGSVVLVVFNRTNGVYVSSSTSGTVFSGLTYSTEAAGGNWSRFSVTVTTTGGAGGLIAFLVPQQVAGTNAYAGTNGTAAMVIWGAQLENAAIVSPLGSIGTTFPTMYLPTTTAAITQQDWTGIGATGIMNFNTANLASIAGIQLLWSGTFFYRVRFDDDAIEFKQIMNQLWSVEIKLRQVKL
jgi:hypothetical protein